MKNFQPVPSETLISNNVFNKALLVSIIRQAKAAGYKFYTLRDYIKAGMPKEKAFVLRLDLDFKPQTHKIFNDLIREEGITFTTFVRVGGPYNFLWYPNFAILDEAAKLGAEIGLHSNNVEWAVINGRTPEQVFAGEMDVLQNYFDVVGFAPHRDINYMYNTLPWLEQNWDTIKARHKLEYQAYDKALFDNALYLNEGLNPHLCWRGKTPQDVIPTGQSIYMLLHPHWWHESHAFEVD
jgi:hypothetical protein